MLACTRQPQPPCRTGTSFAACMKSLSQWTSPPLPHPPVCALAVLQASAAVWSHSGALSWLLIVKGMPVNFKGNGLYQPGVPSFASVIARSAGAGVRVARDHISWCGIIHIMLCPPRWRPGEPQRAGGRFLCPAFERGVLTSNLQPSLQAGGRSCFSGCARCHRMIGAYTAGCWQRGGPQTGGNRCQQARRWGC